MTMSPIELLASGTDGVVDEVAFESPWSARLFGMTLALAKAGQFTVREFQQAMIASIREYEKTGCIDGNDTYYERWIEALLSLLKGKGLIGDAALAAVEARLRAATPPRHAHQHDHDHDERLVPEPLAVFR